MKTSARLAAFVTLSLLGAASAQDLRTSLPYTSVGDRLAWTSGDQILRLDVTAAGRVTLDLYSPRVDPADYRSASYYGDEQYDRAGTRTTFTLTDAAGTVVRTVTYDPGRHAWETFLDQDLAAGTYTLKVVTTGNAKNTFAVRLQGNAALAAETLSVNVHSHDWTPALRVTQDGRGPLTLRIYDGDGNAELAVALRGPDGHVRYLPVSTDRDWIEARLPDQAGQYEVLLAQPSTAKQYSNAVTFALLRGTQGVPLTVARAVRAGTLGVGAWLVLPDTRVPTGTAVTVDGADVDVRERDERAVPAGEHTVAARAVPGATVSAPQRVTVAENGRADVTVEVRPVARLDAAVDRISVEVGGTVDLAAFARTAFGGVLPGTLTLDLPEGLTALDDTSGNVGFDAAHDGELHVRARAERAGDYEVVARLAPWGLRQVLHVRAVERPAPTPPPVAQNPEPAPVPQVAPPVQPTPPAPAPDLTLRRSSVVTLPFEAPAVARELVLAHTLPVGATYVPGSSTLDGAPIADPAVGPSGRLYWTLPARTTGTVAYQVEHDGALGALPAPALLARVTSERSEVLMGVLDELDVLRATRTALPADAENDGAIRLPLDGSVVRDRDTVTVVVVRGQGEPATLRVNGQDVPESQVGELTVDPNQGTERLTYYGVKLRPGRNTLTFGASTTTVMHAGPARNVTVGAASSVADGFTPVRIVLRATDASGSPASQDYLTVTSSVTPEAADADPSQGGYQVRLVNGEGVLTLPPQVTPGRVTLDVRLGDRVERATVDLTPSRAAVGVGHASVTLGTQPFGVSAWSARGYYEGMLGDGKLYAAAASDGLPTPLNANDGYPVYGDASVEAQPLRGLDPVALRYEHPSFSVQYRAHNVPISVFGLGEALTALSVTTRGDTGLSAFAALVPEARVKDVLTPDGTRLVRLGRTGVVPGSDTVQLVTREAVSGKEITRVTLVRDTDYVLDPALGTIEFDRPVTPVDERLDDVRVEVTYRLLDATTNRLPAWGAQVRTRLGDVSAAAAVVNLDGRTTTGASAQYVQGDTRLDAHAALAEGAQASLDGATKVLGANASFGVRYQDASYSGLNAFETGWTAQANVSSPLANVLPGLSVAADAAYRDTFTNRYGSFGAQGRLTSGAWTFGVGARSAFGDTSGLSALGSVRYAEGPLDIAVTHAQPLTGDVTPNSTASVKFSVLPNVTLRALGRTDWTSDTRATFGVTSTVGGMRVNADYDLPTADGQGNRARFGADTTFAVTPTVSVGVQGALTRDLDDGTGTASVGGSVRYKTDDVSATLGGDVALTNGVPRAVVRGGVTGTVTPDFTLSADVLSEFSVAPGTRASVSGAYRGEQTSALGYVRLQTGSLGGGTPNVTAEVSAEHHTASFAVRGGLAARTLLDDPGSLTVQPGLGATAYLTDRIGVGVGARAQFQPSTGTARFGLGVEGSVLTLPGTWVTVGYNFTGFEGIGNTYTRQGLYFRLDLILDEQNGGGR
ncbi:hypothetical protein [Deinococcus pimensis]|uniref:hypothetical protein n=1 Tax=Deinococcus pimensis TaxID=309888 RepID=UPI0004BC699D|nr:hypothetical protein [Deinococcus pimensis]